jgi:hypothetical protein
VIVFVFMFQVHIEFRSRDASPLLPRRVQVVIILKAQFFQLTFQGIEIHPQIQESAEEHIAADTAKEIQVECFHQP